jgi:septal ring factor EnvC (AmiA/AmiB activator)
VKEDDFEQFLSEIYKKCENRGITPEKIALHIEDLARFSDNTRLPEIGEYLSEKLFEVMVHNDRKQGLMYDISKLQGQKLQIERNRDELLANKNEIEEEIENYHKVIQQLDSYGLDMTDFRGFAKVIQSMKELRFETLKIASDVNEAANFKREKDRKLAELKKLIDSLIILDAGINPLKLQSIRIYKDCPFTMNSNG